jgi:hypothetical protein
MVSDGASISAVFANHGDPVAVDGVAPAPLASVSLPSELSLTGAPTVTWSPGDAEAVEIRLEVTGLGSIKVLSCRTADTGSFAIPTEALALLATHESQALLAVTRRSFGHTSSATADLALDLAVESEVFRTVQPTP